jgi:hypothetical protein
MAKILYGKLGIEDLVTGTESVQQSRINANGNLTTVTINPVNAGTLTMEDGVTTIESAISSGGGGTHNHDDAYEPAGSGMINALIFGG